ncbi:hypothetical protein DRW03_10030 [Corallococcus sp. H22C18031201]|nr:hypothetical protein [Citreicoccus inhibens]RJS23950.1 hypothetical protein DRW03_10030 [Corallococcus sp. H22C18031201]
MNPMKSSSRAAALWVVSALAFALSGCAAHRQQAFLEDKAGTHVYRKPIAEVWPEALAILKARGYSFRTGKEGYEAVTHELQLSAASSLGTTFGAYMIRGKEHGPGQCSVEFWKRERSETRAAADTQGRGPDLSESPGGVSNAQGKRDLEVEWELLQKVDPDAAASLKAEALKVQ